MTAKAKALHTAYIPIDDREPATVRAVILARKSDYGSDDDVASQVEACKDFIARKGWHLVADPYDFAEKGKTGMHRVRRPALDAVLSLIEQRRVDVVVARELERVARKSELRAVILASAQRLGAEFRFANLPPDGTLPDDLTSRMARPILEAFGELEADRIRERTWGGRVRRFEAGLPGSGRGGPPYGFAWRPKAADQKSYTGYVLLPEEAERLRSWYERLDSDETLTVRRLATELGEQGAPTPTGAGRWTATTVARLLRNPIYCGRGRLLRYHVTSKDVQWESGEVYMERQIRDRARDKAAWDDETLPFAEGVIPKPPIVSPDLWDRVQAKIAYRRTYAGRLGRSASEHKPDETLLHGGFVRCAHCRDAMVRYWRGKVPGQTAIPYYRCAKQGGDPSHPCKVHAIPAPDVDALVCQVLAEVLTDPERLADLADANAERLAQATSDLAIATATLESLRDRLDELTDDRDRYARVLAALHPVKDAEEIALYEAKQAKVTEDRTAAERDLAAATPRRDRAKRREWLLRVLRNRGIIVDFETGRVTESDEPRPLPQTLGLDVVTELLGHASPREQYNEYRRQRGEPPLPNNEEADWYVENLLRDTGQWRKPSAAVVARLLRESPVPAVRRALRDLDVVVWVSRPRPAADRAARGRTPVAERVTVSVGELTVKAANGSLGESYATKLDTTTSNVSSAKGKRRASPSCTCTRSATPSSCALRSAASGRLPLTAPRTHMSRPMALPLVKRRAAPMSRRPRPQPTSRTSSSPRQGT
jgi:DNA invertase Pin-like site-specific DNA recombinase